ncbi:MAG: U32 family peptidase [Candidatus Spyradenecus sp.]
MSPSAQHELLAPAGSFEAALAAFTYGADAIYLGLQRFSARADATNFSDEQLRQIVAYARQLPRPRKIYVTLNTLLETREFAELPAAIDLLAELAIDGVIVQDLGVAALIRERAPTLPLHASTQLACTSEAGARALKALGFVRIVTARELPLREAAEIGRRVGIEIEVFIHGALCYSLSGLCLYSSLTTARSGNRGRCAYCCRQRFCDEAGATCHPFSMRDLALADDAELLRALPIASYKIEGRMKNPLYVAAVTDLYRHLLDGSLSPEALTAKAEDLRTIFSRPWTPLYARSAETPPEAIIDPLCVGHRGSPIGRVRRLLRETDGRRWLCFQTSRELERHDGLQIDLPGRPVGFAVDRLRDGRTRRSAITLPAGAAVEVELPREVGDLPIGATVYCSASQAVRRAFPVPKPRATELRLLRPVDLTLTLEPTRLILEGLGHTCSVAASLAPAKDPARSESAARDLLSRLGEHGFALRALTFHNPLGLFLPASLLNTLRRTWAEGVAQAVPPTEAVAIPEPSEAPEAVIAAPEPPALSLKVAAGQRPEALGLDRALPSGDLVLLLTPELTLEALAPWRALVPPERLRYALPVALRNADLGPMAALVGALADRGARRFECADLTSWQLLRDLQPGCDAFDLSADWTWYATNARAARLQSALGLTQAITGPEANLPNLLTLPRTLRREVLIAQYAPHFIAFTRPLAQGNRLLGRNGEHLRIARLGRLWITFDERPWALSPAQRRDLATHGFTRQRIDLAWAAEALPAPLDWRTLPSASETLSAHFSTPRL